jgi:hypothetical protein
MREHKREFRLQNLEIPEGPHPILGEGKSYTTRPDARLWRVQFKLPAQPLMRLSIRASSKGQAMLFARNRWPLAQEVEVLGEVAL